MKNTAIKTLIMVFLLSVLPIIGCSGIKEEKFSKTNQEEVLKKVSQSKELSQEEKDLIIAYFKQPKYCNEDPVGKTVNQILEEQKSFVAGEKRLKEALSFNISDWQFSDKNGSGIIIKAVYQNNSGKDIRAFRGFVVVQDLFGDVSLNYTLTITEPIKAGEKVNWSGTIFQDTLMAMIDKYDQNVKRKDMKIFWDALRIIFIDGSEI